MAYCAVEDNGKGILVFLNFGAVFSRMRESGTAPRNCPFLVAADTTGVETFVPLLEALFFTEDVDRELLLGAFFFALGSSEALPRRVTRFLRPFVTAPLITALTGKFDFPKSSIILSLISGAPSLNACEVFSRAFLSPMSSHRPVLLFFVKNRPEGLRVRISATISFETVGLSLFELCKYCRFLLATRRRNRSLPEWLLVPPPLPQRTSLACGILMPLIC
mmetsp:Transcript_8721/g.19161  ORF Transcript_8721/g.19161 Transcript_8721/m.19161 type:complete len:220 (+) Transcript_8721:2142-2801(+)